MEAVHMYICMVSRELQVITEKAFQTVKNSKF